MLHYPDVSSKEYTIDGEFYITLENLVRKNNIKALTVLKYKKIHFKLFFKFYCFFFSFNK